MNINFTKKGSFAAGFGIIEIAVVAGIVSVVFLGMFQLAIVANRPVAGSARETEATYLAEEGIEAVRVLRNEGWDSHITTISNTTNYYPTISANRWTLNTIDPGAINGTYTRVIVLSAVYRDTDDNISSTGTLDANTRKVTSTVTWNEHGIIRSVVLETYITNFFDT